MRNRSAFGWGELVVGIALVVLGIFTFARPSSALTGIVFVYGLLAVVTGIADIAFYVKIEKHTGFGPVVSLITGILSILAGVLLLFNPDAVKWAMALLFPLWFITHCISRLTHLPVIRLTAGSGYYYCTLIVNILGLILGFVMIVNPMLSLFSVSYVIGIYLLLAGIDHLVLAVSSIGKRG